MSTIEIYWSAIAAKVNDSRTWHQLHPQHQHMITQSWNLLSAVLQDGTNG
jgi:hypothetical protein